jgi:hypothetical protein
MSEIKENDSLSEFKIGKNFIELKNFRGESITIKLEKILLIKGNSSRTLFFYLENNVPGNGNIQWSFVSSKAMKKCHQELMIRLQEL